MAKFSPSLINLWILQIYFLLFVMILNWVSLPSTMALTSGSETDRLALLALKDKLTNGVPGALSSWNDSLQFCHWPGVSCGKRHQRVTALTLNSQNLAGSISPSIGNLTFLRELSFFENRLHGVIPGEFGRLRRLQYLNLTSNNLQGKIPVELTNCSNLQYLTLSRNNLTGEIPFQFGYMLQLSALILGGNNLTGRIPLALANISSLSFLSLAFNHLHGSIPHVMSGMTSLEVLFLAMNNLSGMITPLYNLSSMIALDVSDNKFSGNLLSNIDFAFPNLQGLFVGVNHFTGTIPTSISNISSLQLIDMVSNGFEGLVPNTLGKMKNLRELFLGYNSLGSGKAGDLSFLSSLANCTRLEKLTMNGNRFGGEIPNSVANSSTQLRELYMGRNQISGSIPEGIGDLASLTILEMGINFLVGVIPASIAKLKNLQRLFLHRNNLSGNIPSFIGNLSRLFDLYLHTNNFEGSIPLTLRNCTNMQNLRLHENNLSGNIPDQVFGFCESLILVNISYNSLNGPLPSDLGNLKNLVVLIVSENKFSGEIPVKLGECSGLSYLDLSGNNFEGSIPLSLSSLKSLELLNLSHNSLSGTIPQQLQNLSFLTSLNLSFNHLEGEVPTEGVFMDANKFSIIGNDDLCGGIPEIQLPSCLNQEPRKKRNSLSTKVIIAIIISILFSSTLIVALVFLCWRRKRGKDIGPASILGDSFLRISYKELLQATDGFASSNLIGAGSFGTVYKGSLQQLGRPVAVKVLNPQNRGASKSFLAECKALSKVRHRNLLKIITSCSSLDYNGNDFKALVLEFMPNGSLESWLHIADESKLINLNLIQRLNIAIDVAYALDYLHHHCETPIVHCDLKPTNILLDDDLVAHVGDFGLAKLLSGVSVNFSGDQTNSSAIKGTIGYVAPEYGMGGMVSPEGDVYSYGILLLEMITGKRPTDEMFSEGLRLHEFCQMALPERVRDIVDSRLLGLLYENISSARNQHIVEGKMLECLVSFCRIGVACSADLPGERMKIQDVITELHTTKARILQAGT